MPLLNRLPVFSRRDGPRLALLAGFVLAFMAWATFQMPLSPGARMAVWGAAGVAALLILAGLWGVWRARRHAAALAVPEAPSRSRDIMLLALCLAVALVLAIVPAPGVWAWLATLGTLLGVLGALFLGLRIARQGTSVLYRQALLLHRDANYDEALARLDLLLKERPNDPAGLQLRAIIQRQAGHHGLAHQAAQALIAAHPQLYYGYAESGLTYLAQRQPARACAPLEQAAKLAPSLADAHYNLGLACAGAKRIEQSIAPFERALALGLADDADRLIAWYQLHRAYTASNQADKAARALRQVRRHRGVLRRWRSAVRDQGLIGGTRDEELTLIGEIERLIGASTV